MKLQFKFSRKETPKVRHLSMWFEVLFPNAILNEELTSDNSVILTLYDPNISEEGNSYYDDNIVVDTLLKGYPSFPSMTNWFYRMDSRILWGSYNDELSSSDTVSHSSFELEYTIDEDGNEIENRNDEIETALKTLSAFTNLKLNKYSDFRVFKSSSEDNVQLTSYDLKRIVASSLMNLKPSLCEVNTYNIDGYRTDANRQELKTSSNYVSPTLEIARTISP